MKKEAKIGWTKTVQPIIFDRNNYLTQWLIGIFVRFFSFKDDLINCAGVRQLKRFGEPFQPKPKNKEAKQF